MYKRIYVDKTFELVTDNVTNLRVVFVCVYIYLAAIPTQTVLPVYVDQLTGVTVLSAASVTMATATVTCTECLN